MTWTPVQQAIIAAANAQGVPPGLALAVADQESGFDQTMVGAAGDTGIFQIIPSTAAALGIDPSDLNQNIWGGVAYLAQQLGTFGSTTLALWAYNAGPGAVRAYLATGKPVPASTQRYAAAVLAKVPRYQSLIASAAPPPGSPARPGGGSALPWVLGGFGVVVLLAVLAD